MIKQSSKSTKIKTEYHLYSEDIIRWLVTSRTIPEGARIESVTFQVPGGGDYSNMSLDIDKDNPIIIKTIQEVYNET